jgi:hypothetical protein
LTFDITLSTFEQLIHIKQIPIQFQYKLEYARS